MGEKKYKVGSDIYDIPEAEAQSFLKDYPDAEEIETFTVGKDTFDIPLTEKDAFLAEFPDAKTIKKKVSSEVSGESAEISSTEQPPLVSDNLEKPDLSLTLPQAGFKETTPETVGLDYLQGKEVPRAPKEAGTIKEAVGATIGEFGRSFSSMIGDFGKLGTKIQDSFASLFLDDKQLKRFKEARDKNELTPQGGMTLTPARNLSNLLAQSVANTKQLPKGVVGDVTRGMINIIPDMTLAMAAPELALPRIFTRLGLKQIGKFGLEQGFRGMVEGMDEAEYAPQNLRIGIPLLRSLERGMTGWMYEGMGHNASIVGEKIANKLMPNAKATGDLINKSILQTGSTALTNGLYFSGYGGLDEYLRTGKITPENMYSNFGMGFAFSVPEMGKLLFVKGMNTVLSSPREGLRKIAQSDISSTDLAKKSDEIAKNVEDGKSENPEGDAVIAFMLNKASQLKAVVDEIKDNPADVKTAINESDIDSKVKEALVDRVNEVVADNDPKVQEAKKYTDDIDLIDQALDDIKKNKSWNTTIKKAESEPLNRKKAELEQKVLEIYGKAEPKPKEGDGEKKKDKPLTKEDKAKIDEVLKKEEPKIEEETEDATRDRTENKEVVEQGAPRVVEGETDVSTVRNDERAGVVEQQEQEVKPLTKEDFDKEGDLTDGGFVKLNNSLVSIINDVANKSGIPIKPLLKHYNINDKGEYFTSLKPLLKVGESTNFNDLIETIKKVAIEVNPEQSERIINTVSKYKGEWLNALEKGDKSFVLPKEISDIYDAINEINDRFVKAKTVQETPPFTEHEQVPKVKQVQQDQILHPIVGTEQKTKIGAMDDPTWHQDATKLYKEYEDAIRLYETDNNNESYGQGMEDAGKKWRYYKDALRAAYSAGNISETELGNLSTLAKKVSIGDLKDVGGRDVYHFTIAADKVGVEGLLTKAEVIQRGGKEAIGGGGGISFTTDLEYAQTLYNVFREMQEALRGNVNIAGEFIALEKSNPDRSKSIIDAISSYMGGTDTDIRDAIINNKITYNRNRVKMKSEMKEGDRWPTVVNEPISKYDFVKQYFNALTMFSPKREWVALFHPIEGLENAELGIFKGKTKFNAKGELYPAEREIRVHSGDAVENLKRIDTPAKKPTRGGTLKTKEAKLKDEIAKGLDDLVFLMGGVQKITGAERPDIITTLTTLIKNIGDLTLLKGEQLYNRVKEELKSKNIIISDDILNKAFESQQNKSVEPLSTPSGGNVPPTGESVSKTPIEGRETKFRKTQINSLIQDQTLQQQEVAKIVDANKERYNVLHQKEAIDQAKALIDNLGVQGASLELKKKSRNEDLPIRQVARQVLLDFYSRAIIDPNASEADKKVAFENIDDLQQIIAREATKAGQANALLQIWKDQQPAGVLEYVRRKIEQSNQKVLDKKIGETTLGDQLNELFGTLDNESKNIIKDILAGKKITLPSEETKVKPPSTRKFVPKERIKQEQDYRKNLLAEFKRKQGGTLSASVTGLTSEQMELGGNLLASYIREGYYRAQEVIDRLKQDFRSVGVNVGDDQAKELLSGAKNNKETYGEYLDRKESQARMREGEKLISKKISDVITEHWTEKDELKRTLAQKLMDEAGLTEAEAKRLEKEILEKFDKEILERSQKQLTKILGTKKIPTDKKKKGIVDKMIDLINMGALDEQLYRDLFAEKFNLVEITDQHKAEILRLANNVQMASGKGMLERDATIKLAKYIYELYPQDRVSEVLDTWMALAYANMLMGVSTSVLNLSSAGSNMALNPVHDISNLTKWLRLLKSAAKGEGDIYNPFGEMAYAPALRGIKYGLQEALEVFRNGDLNNKYIEQVAKKGQFKVTSLERNKYGEAKRFKPINFMGRDLNIFNLYKYSGRNLAAQDKLMLTTSYEIEVAKILRDKLKNKNLRGRALTKEVMTLMRGDRLDMDQINKTVEEDAQLYKKMNGENMTPLQKRIRQRELELEQLPLTPEEREEAEKLARGNIFTDDRGGLFATLAGGIGQMANSSQLAGMVIKPFVPFTKVVGNVAEYMMDHTPYYGLMRANGMSISTLAKKIAHIEGETAQMGKKGTRAYDEQMGRAWFGTLSFSLALMMLLGNDEEDFIEVSGGYNQEGFKKRGRENVLPQYTLRIGDFKLTYKNIPGLAIPLSLVGNINDALKMGQDEGDIQDRLTASLLFDATMNSVFMVKDMSFLDGMQKGTQIISDIASSDEKKLAKVGEGLIQSYLGFMTRALPENNNAIQQIWKIFDPVSYSQSDIKGMLGYAAGLQHILNRPVLDQLGDEVKTYPGESLMPYTHWLNLKGNDKRWQFLAKYNAIPNKIYNRKMLLETESGIEPRQLEEDELFDYTKRAGKLFSDSLVEYMSKKDKVAEREKEIVERKKSSGELEKVSGVREDVEKLWSEAKDRAEVELFRWGSVKEEMPSTWNLIKKYEAYHPYQDSKETEGYKWSDSELYEFNNFATLKYAELVKGYLSGNTIEKDKKSGAFQNYIDKTWEAAKKYAESLMSGRIKAKAKKE